MMPLNNQDPTKQHKKPNNLYNNIVLKGVKIAYGSLGQWHIAASSLLLLKIYRVHSTWRPDQPQNFQIDHHITEGGGKYIKSFPK